MKLGPTVPTPDLLADLRPVVGSSLDRHMKTATEWFPHEFVPYEEGRSFLEEPWAPSDSRLDDVAQTALEINLLTEDNLPYYHLAIWETFGGDGPWAEWIRRWTAEEGRHAIVLRDYLTVTRGIDPMALERGRMDQVSRGYYFDDQMSPLDGLVYTTLQELATRISHRNTGTFTEDPVIEKLTARIAVDENLHYVFYRDVASAAIEMDPSAMVLAMRRQVLGFQMPGLELPAFRKKAITIAKAGIYDLRIHHDQVLVPVLYRKWKLDELTGLSDEAERARDEIRDFLAMVDITARRYEAKRAVRASVGSGASRSS
jgi:acyl-[acyl-carrier-protein] desaturase